MIIKNLQKWLIVRQIFVRSLEKRKKIFLFMCVLCVISIICGLFKGAQETATVCPTNVDTWSLFNHNSLVAILIIIFGFFTMGVISSLGIIYIFFVQGYIVSSVTHSYNFDIIVRAILPHAFFELTAFFLVGVIATDGYCYFRTLKKFFTGKIAKQRYDWSEFFILLMFIFLLLLIAAIIESNISI